MKVSRSRLFATALREFIERRRNRELLRAIDAAYGGATDQGEGRLRQALQGRHRRLVQGQW